MPSIFSSILLLFSSSLIAFLSSHSAMATSNFLAMDDFQSGNGSSSFMDSLSAEQQKQFFEIVMNPNASKAQQKNQLAAWASSSGVQSQYESCLQRMQQDFAQMESVAQQNLQGSALNLFNQLASLHKDDSLTSLQECGQMFDIFNSTQPPTVLMFVPKKWFVDQCSPAMIGQKFEGGDSDSDIEPNDGDEEEK